MSVILIHVYQQIRRHNLINTFGNRVLYSKPFCDRESFFRIEWKLFTYINYGRIPIK